MKKEKNNQKKFKVILIIVILLILFGGGVIYYGYKNNWFNEKTNVKIKEIINKIPLKQEKKIQVIDLNSDARPYAVMIDNIKAARPQYGISKAYIIYEMIVEGGLTRMLALFKDSNIEQIGPVRSARHYFLDYVMENDAIYVHFGWSPQAESDISNYKIQNLNGLANPSNMFWRDSRLHKSPHNAYTSTVNMLKAAGNKKYRTNSNEFKLLNYVIDEFDLADKFPEDGQTIIANEIRVDYSNGVYNTFTYDEIKKTYLKGVNGTSHIDAANNETLDFKNIIVVTGISNQTIDTQKNRQDIKNIGSGEAYYITNGKAIKVTWNKASRNAKTIYKDKEGKEIEINDGKTFINIQPTGQKITIN